MVCTVNWISWLDCALDGRSKASPTLALKQPPMLRYGISQGSRSGNTRRFRSLAECFADLYLIPAIVPDRQASLRQRLGRRIAHGYPRTAYFLFPRSVNPQLATGKAKSKATCDFPSCQTLTQLAERSDCVAARKFPHKGLRIHLRSPDRGSYFAINLQSYDPHSRH